MAVTAPPACRARTSRSLCSGATRANTSVTGVRARSSSSDAAAISVPVTGGACPTMPSSRPIAAAVAAWSPVIILTAMPARWQVSMASTTSSRGGSIRPTSPSSRRSWSSGASTAPPGRSATARTRSPSAAYRSRTAYAAAATPGSTCASRTSGAPFTYVTSGPSGGADPGSAAGELAMYWRAESKGSTARGGWRPNRSARSTPARSAPTSSAPSVGSPNTLRASPSPSSCASLASAPATSSRRSAPSPPRSPAWTAMRPAAA